MKITARALGPLLLFSIAAFAQEDTRDFYPASKYKPLKINASDNVHVTFVLWHQQWLITNNLDDGTKFQMATLARRSRVLALAQISPRFLLLTHFGLNNLTAQVNQTALGNDGDGPQLFLHGAWTEFKVSRTNTLYVGTGLHYWRGLTRLSNASTINLMTLDQARPFTHWHSLGITDQFARHMGIYAKGQIGKFDYRIAWNNPLNPNNALGQGANFGEAFVGAKPSDITYNGRSIVDVNDDPVGNSIVEGYFRYNFFDTESTVLPYQVGTYFGNKKVLGIGMGFFSHPNGIYNNTTNEHGHVFHFAFDAFYDAPLGAGCINAYASFISFDYGKNYVSRWAGTGTNLYGQVGYHLPGMHLMPYVAAQTGDYEALRDNINSLDFGVNYYVNGHNAKITLEYHMERNDFRDSPAEEVGGNNGNISQIRLQTHIFL